MIYIEMSKDPVHGGGNWSFPNCLWAPTKKKNGTRWAFWEKIAEVREGDAVIHLRKANLRWAFVGNSIASGNAFETNTRPPEPGEWNFSDKFFRVDLSGFTPFHEVVRLDVLFSSRKHELEEYFVRNRQRSSQKKRLFYVKQSGQLQCLNGAYLSEVDDELLDALFPEGGIVDPGSGSPVISVPTSEQLGQVRTRRGQRDFSDGIKNLYGYKCCFPSCSVSDPRFLVASHIARWCDNKERRGDFANGLCFCILHDKAFELGVFTLDKNFCISINPREQKNKFLIFEGLLDTHGNQISLSRISPSLEALKEHWNRVGIKL